MMFYRNNNPKRELAKKRRKGRRATKKHRLKMLAVIFESNINRVIEEIGESGNVDINDV